MKDTATLVVEGTDVTGEHESAFGKTQIENGIIERTFGDRSVKVHYNGLIRGDLIKGTSQFVPSGATESAASAASQWATRWEAKRE